MGEPLTNVLTDILKVEGIEEAFSCFLVHRPSAEKEKVAVWQQELNTALRSIPQEQLDTALRQYLNTAVLCSQSKLQLLMELLESVVRNGTIGARIVCEVVMNFDKLQHTNARFWIECFKLVRKIIDLVEYKGVREIMKGCCEKAKSLPWRLNAGLQPQTQALLSVAERIMDRNACLLPGYLLVNELQKAYPDCPHWRLAALFSDYVGSFRACAQMVAIVGQAEMRPVVEHSGCPEHLVNPWKLDPCTLRFSLKGTLPYAPELLEKQTGLLRYVLEQPYSRDMVCGMLGLQKQHKRHCAALEEQLVELVILALERTENEGDESATQGLWLHLSSQLIYFVLFQFASFPNIVISLHSRLQGRDLRRGRDQLMWVLLQFISGSIQKNPLSNFLPVLRLYELLFPEQEPPLPVPDFNQPQCTRQMAMTCIWIHLTKKAQAEMTNLTWPIPAKLRNHHDFLQQLVPPNNTVLAMGNDYRIALLCNAYSTNPDYYSKPMAALVETIQGSPKSTAPPTAPLSMAVLDSLTVHSKMSLIHSIVTHVIKLAQAKLGMPLSPALVETYSRLLVYTEIESLGIKGFISQLLPTVYKSHAWGTLYTLLEMFSYRMHHIHPHYRVQLLSHLHSLAAVPQANQTQLHLCVESTALRLITGLGSGEVQPELSRFLAEPKTLISAESEELNRALVLTLARATHVTGADGSWCHELLATIAQSTPHAWAPHTLECFPRALAEFFTQHAVPKENKQQLKKAVEEEYRKWSSMNNENDMMAHFGVAGAPPLFLCLLWKMLLETDHITPIAYKILERIGARALSAHLRKFCDCLVFEFSNSPGGQHVNKCVDTINDMIWKYNIVTIDRLVLCLALRTQEGSEAQVCSFIIQLVLLKATEFRNRVQDFVKDNSPDHWNQTNWHEKHLEFHRKYPEKFAPEEQSSGYHPYFGNVCLRFLPVFDIVVHRFLEIPQVTKSLEILLEHLGCLYKFHDRPVTYLYNTLHYYETRLRDRPPLKRRLVAAVLGTLKDSLSEPYQLYLGRAADEMWTPELDYYIQVVKRVVDILGGATANSVIDWRFNEFPNAGAHILYTSCVELMALSAGPVAVANGLLDVVAKGYVTIPSSDIHQWVNAVGLILAALPVSYWSVLHDRLVATLNELETWNFDCSPFRLFDFKETHAGLLHNNFSYMLALAHSVWHHAGPGQIASVPRWARECLPAVVRSEEQFLYVCHLVGPFLQRFNVAIVELTSALYELLAQVDHAHSELKYMDPICDLLYHIKYMFVGDSMKKELETVVRRLRPPLQMRLRFIAHLAIEEVNAS
ncbi:mediator of RNA polymerase II transcription subunit 23 [Tribolium castaneum]|uniref:Mediator of RNA polymerase II transcription subunit 23 n=1 Tax=Tribolium castaneum TaxID=7070 RepID=D6WF99_TRICA|nr:PREDICTED: mediator of RNA polymerase II transcription subunit 23 [Tribolium castaneum]EFA00475.1 Mediator of RNA polymerase II transcription subunit 23-like Protein [Tribolium castaneum]|eukprot:XP_970233.1 PREDICTED: mediator of RNA polymerase II transcription subunit 23 [Tribolium castaneum]